MDDHIKYKNYRKMLKYSIKVAQKMYYNNQFANVNSDLKKTWKLINKLRGKVKQQIKPYFIFNDLLLKIDV